MRVDIPFPVNVVPALIDLRQTIAHRLEEVGIGNGFDEAKWLICAALKVDAGFFITHQDELLAPAQLKAIESFLQRRLLREPLSRIRGVREFWSLPFHLNEHTLDPRPDSEVVVEAALKLIPEFEPYTILDLGTGSGCLLISLLHERPVCQGIGVDLSPGAVMQARKNAVFNKVEDRALFVAASWGDALGDYSFDLVISNPPYVPLLDEKALEPEVAHYDPDLALYGGEDGLKCYGTLAPEIRRLLKPGGTCVLEIGYEQTNEVRGMYENSQFDFIEKINDLEGRDRGLVFKQPLSE